MSLHRLITLLVPLAILLTACGSAAGPSTNATPLPPVVDTSAVIAEGRVMPKQYADLSFLTGGEVAEVLVSEGQQVAAGDVVARLRTTELEAAVAQAQAGVDGAKARLVQAQAAPQPGQIAEAEAGLRQAQSLAQQAEAQRDQALAGPRKDDVTIAEEQVKQAEAQLRYAESIHDATMASSRGGPIEWQARQQRDIAYSAVQVAKAQLNLVKSGATANERRAAQAGAEAALASVDGAQARLDQLKAGPREEDLGVLRVDITRAEAQLAGAQAALANAELRAPFAGTIAAVSAKAGESVGPAQVVVTVADLSGWVIETRDLTEIEIVKVKVGATATVVLDALPDANLTGQVTAIAPMFVERQGDVTYTVKLDLTADQPDVRWGMTAEVRFAE